MVSVPVLIYHHVAPDREVTPAGFEGQLRWLADHGYRTISAAALHDHLTGAAPAAPKSVVLTFDDGYADNWVYAHPLLKRFGFSAQLFVITDRIGDGPVRPSSEEGGRKEDTITDERGPDGFLRWSELERMRADGTFEIGSHTRSHRGFVRERRYEDLRDELSGSRAAIESRLKVWNGTLAWPWGDFEEP